MIKLKTFQASLVVLALGIAFGIYAVLNTGIDEATGMVNDNLATPISALLLLVGVVLLGVSMVIYFKNRKK